jgi:hypothetical protein
LKTKKAGWLQGLTSVILAIWLTSIILAIQKAEIRRMEVREQTGQKVNETSSTDKADCGSKFCHPIYVESIN